MEVGSGGAVDGGIGLDGYGVKVEPRSNNAIAAGLSSFKGTTHHKGLDHGLHDLLEAETDDCSKWDIIDTSQNVYNRAILFPAHWCHTGLNYFGDSVENGRLYQAFFFRGYPMFRVS
jgi:hypothetical protein